MSISDVIHAWKDETYRQSLSAEEQAQVPEHPAGSIELADGQLEPVNGGGGVSNADFSCASCDFYCPPTSLINPDCLTTLTL